MAVTWNIIYVEYDFGKKISTLFGSKNLVWAWKWRFIGYIFIWVVFWNNCMKILRIASLGCKSLHIIYRDIWSKISDSMHHTAHEILTFTCLSNSRNNVIIYYKSFDSFSKVNRTTLPFPKSSQHLFIKIFCNIWKTCWSC